MIATVMTAMGTGFTSMATAIGEGVGSVVPTVMPLMGTTIAIGFVIKIVRKFAS